MASKSIHLACLALFSVALGFSTPSLAQKKYDPGASDTEIKIGNIMPYSGPASAYSLIGRTEEAYFRKINDEGRSCAPVPAQAGGRKRCSVNQ